MKAFKKLKDKRFINNMTKDIKYQPKKSLQKIVNILSTTDTSRILQKGFADL